MSPSERPASASRLRALAAVDPGRDTPAGGMADDPPRSGDARQGAWVPTAIRAASDEYGRAHPDPFDGPDDEPAPGGVRRPRDVRRIRWAVSWRVVGTATLAVALVVGAVVLRSVALTPGIAVDLPSPLGTATAEASAAPTASPAVVVVHVVGAVVAPGVVRLPAGSRVVDALAAAGGATDDADVAQLNLARVLLDGEQVVVPRPGDPTPTTAGETGAAGGAGGLVDLNTASLAELDGLPGVGPVLAQRIVDRRPFTSVDELDEVSGVGPTLLERLRPLVVV